MYDVGCEIDSIGDSSSCDDDTEIGTTVVLINGQRHVLSGDILHNPNTVPIPCVRSREYNVTVFQSLYSRKWKNLRKYVFDYLLRDIKQFYDSQKANIKAEGGATVVNIPGMRNFQIGDGQINFITGQTSRSHHRKQSPTRIPKADSSEHRERHHHAELSDSTLKPSRSDLNHVCNNIGKNWKKLGNELGLGRGQIEAIEIDYRVEGTYEMAYQTILKWKRQNGDQVAIRDLALALDSIGMSELARELPVK